MCAIFEVMLCVLKMCMFGLNANISILDDNDVLFIPGFFISLFFFK